MSSSPDFDSGSNIVYDNDGGAASGTGTGGGGGEHAVGGSPAATQSPDSRTADSHDDGDVRDDEQSPDETGADMATGVEGHAVGAGMNARSSSPGVPSPAELLVLEREAEQLTQGEVESLLSFLADFYTIDLVRLSGKDSAHDASGVREQQQQLVMDILRVEGCAQCLQAHTYEQDAAAQADDASKGPEGAATARAANDAYILLGCKLLHCKHVVHVLCVLKLQAKLRAAAAAGSSGGAIAKLILPTLDLTHSTSFFRVIAFPAGTQGSLLPSLPSPHSTPSHPTHSYYLELASTHHMSNAQNLHLTWTHAPVHSYVDARTGGEYLMLLANHPDASSADGEHHPRPQDLTIHPQGSNAASTKDFAAFALTRGKFHFTCIQQTSGKANVGKASSLAPPPQISNHWSHTTNYDLSSTTSSGPVPHLKLVMVDAHSKNVLTIGVQKINHAPAQPGAEAALAIAYIKYEFAQPMATPPLSPPLSLHTHPTPPTSVMSVLAGAGAGGAFTGGAAAGGLDAFTGSTGALAGSAGAFGGAPIPVGAGAFGAGVGRGAGGFDVSHTGADSIVRDPRDPPTMRIGHGGHVVGGPDPLAGIAGIDPRDPPRVHNMAPAQGSASFQSFDRYERERGGDGRRDGGNRDSRGGRNNDRFNSSAAGGAGGAGGGGDFFSPNNAASGGNSGGVTDSGDWDLAMLDAALDRQLAERRHKPDPFGERSGSSAAGGGGSAGGQWDRRRVSDDRGSSGLDASSGGGNGQQGGNDNDALFLPALPTFPTHLMNAPGMATQPVLNLTLEQVKGNVVRLAKSHSGSRFVQAKLEAHDAAFFALFYEEMRDHVAELMVDGFGHFAIEKLTALCNDEQALTLLQRLAPSINIVACQKHGSFSVQALVDTLHTPAQIYTLVEAMKPDILRIITHASGHFVVLRMLQRFPYQSTKIIDEAIVSNCSSIGTDHHGLRVVKAVLAVRRSTELTRLFKQVARLTMKLVENSYGNYVIQAVLDVAPPGVRTNIKVKMEGKYMRLSKQKFSSNVVERCLKQSSAHWRTIIIRELIAQPAVSELLRDRYGNYVLQTALAVANAQQVQEILRSITPYLPSLRDNVRSKWKKMLRKAGSLAAAGQAGQGFSGLGGDSPQPTSPASPSSPASRSDSPFQDPPSLALQGGGAGGGGGGGSSSSSSGPGGVNAQSNSQAHGQRVLASVFINPNRGGGGGGGSSHHGGHSQHHGGHQHGMHSMQQSQLQLPFQQGNPHQQQQFANLHHNSNAFSSAGGGLGSQGGGGGDYSERSGGGGGFGGQGGVTNNWAQASSGASSHFGGGGVGAGGYGAGAGSFNPNPLGSYASSYGAGLSAGGNAGGFGANGSSFGLGGGSTSLSSSLAAQLSNPYGVGVAGLNALGGGNGGTGGNTAGSGVGANSLAGLGGYGFGSGAGGAYGVGGVNTAFGGLGIGSGAGGGNAAQGGQTGLNASGLYDPNNANLRF